MTLIATHNGKFHADEVFAISLLQMLDEYRGADIMRTRDLEALKGADVVVDVGGVYDPATHRYDHHQPEFTDSFSAAFKTLLSSAGLVYKHFGRQILQSRAPSLTGEQIEALYVHVYESFVEAFDAHDNGVSAYPANIPRAFAAPFDLFWHVDLLNPAWNAPKEQQTAEATLEAFKTAITLVSSAFSLYLARCLDAWLPARSIVHDALANVSTATHPQILVLSISCPWKDHLFAAPNTQDILYVVYPEWANGGWRVQAVPESPGSFQSRLPLFAAWRGLRDEELDAALVGKVEPGAVFVHRSGFIGGHKTQQGVMQLAALSIALQRA